jgi:RNA polymerase sigma-70 factor, ECF subfamily
MDTLCTTGIDIDSDDLLVAAAKRGDVQAFEQLVLRHQKRVLAVAQRMTNNREDAEDVAQETFHKAFTHLGDFREESQFATWLTRIVMNEAFMLLRRRKRVQEVLLTRSDDDVEGTPEDFVDQSPNPEESYCRQERTELLSEAIKRLGPRIRRTMLLDVVEERSLKETAQLLGISTAAVKSRLLRGRRELHRPANLGRWRVRLSAPPKKCAVHAGAVSVS